MSGYKLIVLTNPTEGADEAYNDWYTNTHLRDVVAVAGFVSAQRFKLRHNMGAEHRHQYLAIYEIESNDPDTVIASLMALQGTDAMVISPALDVEGAVAGLFEPCSPIIRATARSPSLTANG